MKNSKGMGVGSASILVMFVLLCLTCFGALSLVSSQADLKLARQTADSLTAYYVADSRAVDKLRDCENLLHTVSYLDNMITDNDYYYSQCAQVLLDTDASMKVENRREITFVENIDDKRQLAVTFRLIRPAAHHKGHIEVIKWQTIAKGGEYSEEHEVELWAGTEGF